MKLINTKKQQGFSLIEVSVMVAVLGVMSVALLSSKVIEKEHSGLAFSKTRIDEIKTAIEIFYSKYSYIPCVASRTDSPSSANFGKSTDCGAIAGAGVSDPAIPVGYSSSDAIRIGVIPTRTLSLPDSYMFDEWGNRISYSVIKELAIDAVTFDAFTTSVTTGVIQINDSAGSQVTDIDTDSIVAYALFSHGKDKKGAYSKKGTASIVCGSIAMDSENCNNDYVFVESVIDDISTGAGFYYDIFEYTEKNVLSPDSGGSSPNPTILANHLAVGYLHSCAVKNDDTIWCWGANDVSQLGDGTAISQTHTPSPVAGGHTWLSLAYGDGDNHNCAIKSDKTAWCWGVNDNGQLGDNNAGTNSNVPVAVSGGGVWEYIMTSNRQTCGIKDDFSLWCWGLGQEYLLGYGGVSDKHVPTAVAVGEKWGKVEGGEYHTCGIKDDNTLWCWGDNYYGQLGDGAAPADQLVPQQVPGGDKWKDLEAGEYHTCGIKDDDTLWCWGWNNNGQLGDGNSPVDQYSPQIVPGGDTWKDISGGGFHTCGIKTDNTLWCWGEDTFGQLGNAGSGDSDVPVQVDGGGVWLSVNVHWRHSCGIKSDNTAWCWGQNHMGHVGDGTYNNPIQSPTAVIGGHILKN